MNNINDKLLSAAKSGNDEIVKECLADGGFVNCVGLVCRNLVANIAAHCSALLKFDLRYLLLLYIYIYIYI